MVKIEFPFKRASEVGPRVRTEIRDSDSSLEMAEIGLSLLFWAQVFVCAFVRGR